jgi:epsilon-lactone hydrolase
MPSFISRIMRIYVRYTASQGSPDQPVAEKRAKLEADAQRMIKTPKGLVVNPIQAGERAAEWLEINEARARAGAAILYLHGGAYIIGSPRTHRGLAGGIALASGISTLVLDYRLAPEDPFPAALEDAKAAYHWLIGQGYSSIIIGGDSCGGGLTIATAMALREAGAPKPAALFCLSPWSDLSGSGETMRTLAGSDPWINPTELAVNANFYAGEEKLDNPLVSPLFGDMAGLPATLIHVGSDEILLDDSRRLAEKLKTAGVDTRIEIWPGMWHVFQAFAPYVPEARRAIRKIGDFIKEQLK